MARAHAILVRVCVLDDCVAHVHLSAADASGAVCARGDFSHRSFELFRHTGGEIVAAMGLGGLIVKQELSSVVCVRTENHGAANVAVVSMYAAGPEGVVHVDFLDSGLARPTVLARAVFSAEQFRAFIDETCDVEAVVARGGVLAQALEEAA